MLMRPNDSCSTSRAWVEDTTRVASCRAEIERMTSCRHCVFISIDSHN